MVADYRLGILLSVRQTRAIVVPSSTRCAQGDLLLIFLLRPLFAEHVLSVGSFFARSRQRQPFSSAFTYPRGTPHWRVRHFQSSVEAIGSFRNHFRRSYPRPRRGSPLILSPEAMIPIISLFDSIVTHSFISSCGSFVLLFEDISCHSALGSCNILRVVSCSGQLPFQTKRCDPSFFSSRFLGCTWKVMEGGNIVAADIHPALIYLSRFEAKCSPFR